MLEPSVCESVFLDFEMQGWACDISEAPKWESGLSRCRDGCVSMSFLPMGWVTQ